eukprot:CAMPEP_0194274406 /NCGR_PEP_ID=MMETSP0169-20130528/7485_1 /TAXON_ID=218684 /ORGANISM="Corethron pennatum, Strain L29A3" /LENGTH=331 /DNA_ID=CAMNT_0039017585 /DNA_START=266 /DNA_END=1261 /DNA_ORIENTATION=+
MKISFVSAVVILLPAQTSAFVSPIFAKSAVKATGKKKINNKTVVAEKKPAFTFGGKKDAPANDKKAATKKKPPAKNVKAKASPASKKNKDIIASNSPAIKVKLPKLGNVQAPDSTAPEQRAERRRRRRRRNLRRIVPTLSELPGSSPVSIAGLAMESLSPLFAIEAKIQAGVLVTVVDFLGAPLRVYPDEIRAETKRRVKSPKPVLYTYGLSPFSGEAKKILEDYDVEIIEVGPEWFLLGPGGSEKRIALSENSPDLQTSLPHFFIKGESLGGLSTGGRNNQGIVGLKRSGELEKLLKKKPVVKVAPTKPVAKKVVSKKTVPKKKVVPRKK